MSTANVNAAGSVSFKIGAFTGGVGLSEGDYLLKSHSVVLWDYDGKIAGNTIALKILAMPGKVQGKNFTPSGEELNQYYSIGDPTAFSPDATGKQIVAIGSRATLSKSSNFFIFLENLVNAGFPEDQFDNDVSVFDGLVVHITPIPAPQRNLPSSNLVAQANPQQTRERTIPVVSFIHKYPWEAGTAVTVAKPTAAKTVTTAPAASVVQAVPATGEPAEVLAAYLGTVLNGAPALPRVQARVGVFKAMSKVDVPVRDAAMKLFNMDDNLGAVLAGIGDGYYLEGTDIKKIG